MRQRKTGRPAGFELTSRFRRPSMNTSKPRARSPRISVPWPWRSLPLHDHPAIRPACLKLGCHDWPRPTLFRNALTATYQTTLIYRRTGNLRAVQLLFGHILPANTRRKPRSTTLTIRNSVRLSSSKASRHARHRNGSHLASPTARLPACQRGCLPNRLHNTEYANPQRFHLHFCSLCVPKSMRS